MTPPDRRPRFRRAVYAPRADMTNGCRVLLLRLADDMNRNGVVSIPRSKLAEEFGVAPARITENITLAKRLGFLGTVRRGRPGVTAVYQGQIPAPEVRPGVPSDMVRKPGGDLVRDGVPLEDATWYATAGSQVGNAHCPSKAPAGVGSSNEKRQRGEAGRRDGAHAHLSCEHQATEDCDCERRSA